MAKFNKEKLVSGLFGKLSDGDIFVVAGDKLIYEGGKYDDISDMDDDLVFIRSGNYVTEIYEANCFAQVKRGDSRLIWKRGKCEKEVEEKAATPEGTITITEDQFFDAVTKANERFMEIAKETPGKEIVETLMGLQNITFGAVLGAVLFDKEIK